MLSLVTYEVLKHTVKPCIPNPIPYRDYLPTSPSRSNPDKSTICHSAGQRKAYHKIVDAAP